MFPLPLEAVFDKGALWIGTGETFQQYNCPWNSHQDTFFVVGGERPTELQHGHSGILKKKGGEGSGAENGNQIGWQQMMEPGISMCCSSAEGRELLNYWSNLLLRSEFLQDEASLFTNESVHKASVRS